MGTGSCPSNGCRRVCRLTGPHGEANGPAAQHAHPAVPAASQAAPQSQASFRRLPPGRSATRHRGEPVRARNTGVRDAEAEPVRAHRLWAAARGWPAPSRALQATADRVALVVSADAEDIVQDSFNALRSAGPGAIGVDDALGYLLRSVILRCRSARRDAAPTEHSAFASALWTRPAWQREVLALRYFAELSGTQIGAAPGIKWGTVGRRFARASLLRRARNSGDRWFSRH
jgi:DNA-directed RNA polymerase specialized sigma24 family protein